MKSNSKDRDIYPDKKKRPILLILKSLGIILFILICIGAIFHKNVEIQVVKHLQKPASKLVKPSKRHQGTYNAADLTSVSPEDLYYATLHKDELNQSGQISIPSVGINLPVQHGVDYYTTLLGAGEQFPENIVSMGGRGNYTLASHNMEGFSRSNLLFTNLNLVNVGDLIYTTNGTDIFTYKIDLTKQVNIKDVTPLDQDYSKSQITLYTCVSVQTDKILRYVVQGHLESKNSVSEATADQMNAFRQPSSQSTPWEQQMAIYWHESQN